MDAPHYVYVLINGTWRIARYYPKSGDYLLDGDEQERDAKHFDEIGEKVPMPGVCQ